MRQLLSCVVLTEDGCPLTLPPEEFAQKHGWQNDPERVTLK